MKDSRTKTYLFSSLAIILWGCSYIWSDQLISQGIPIFFFVFIRIILAGLLLLAFNKLTGKYVKAEKKDLPKFLLLAFFEPFLYFICETYGLKETGSPTLSAMLIATIPIFSIAAGVIFFKEQISKVNIAGMVICLLGILLVTMKSGDTGEHLIWGIILLVIAVICEVGHASVTKKLSETYTSQVVVMYQFLIGSAYLLPTFLIFGLRGVQPSWFGIKAIYPILCLAILCSAAAFTLWVSTIKKLGVAKSSIFSALIPVATAIIAFTLGQEILEKQQWIGIAVATIGVILSQYNPADEKHITKHR